MIKILFAIVGTLLLANTIQASDKPLLGIVIGANVADVVTTEMARASGNGREVNPLLQNQKVFWGVKAGTTALESILVHQLWTRDQKMAAIAVAFFVGGFNGWVAQHNLRIARMR
jgi:hypothetical protein